MNYKIGMPKDIRSAMYMVLVVLAGSIAIAIVVNANREIAYLDAQTAATEAALR